MARNAHADALLDFLTRSPSPYHAVQNASEQLRQAKARAWNESDDWILQPGQAAYCVRSASTLLAFRAPRNLNPEHLRFRIIGAHTDSPCLKLKPRSGEAAFGYRQWGVEVYGGVLYNSWLDRDLGVAGRLCETEKPYRQTLVHFSDHPIRIPQLAIHLDRQVNEQGLQLNPQRHLVPILGQGGGRELEQWIEAAAQTSLAKVTFDLLLYDRTPPCYGGLNDEFIYSGRLDNLAMSHAALSAFVQTQAEENVVQVIALFDHEEVGSTSSHGADSGLLGFALERVAAGLGLSRLQFLASLSRSFLLSADMAHGLHPNYPERHEPAHFPLLNAGPVLKQNASQRYSSSAETAAVFLSLCAKAGVKPQHFINRADLACGTTIGPLISAQTTIPAADVGNAMLSMHSCREMTGTEDHANMIAVMCALLQD